MKKRINKVLRLIIERTWVVFVIIAFPFGIAFSIITPPTLGLDEGAHFNRIYQISNGDIRSISSSHNQLGGLVPSEASKLQNESQRIRKEDKIKNWKDFYKKTNKTYLGNKKTFANFPGAAAYSPISYGLAPGAFKLLSSLNPSLSLLFVGLRITFFLTYVTLVSYSLYVLKFSSLKWLIFCIALWPQTLFLSSVINTDSLTIALSFLLFSLYVKLYSKKQLSRIELTITLIAALLLPLIKFNYILISACLIFIPKQYIKNIYKHRNFIKILYPLSVAFLIFIPTLLWLFLTREYADFITPERGVADTSLQSGTEGQVRYLLSEPFAFFRVLFKTLVLNGLTENLDYISRMVGYLGHNSVRLPTLVIVSSWSLTLFAAGYAKNDIIKIKKFFTFASVVSLVMVLGIFGILYLTVTTVGDSVIRGVQGRYFIPLAPFLISGLFVYLPLKVSINGRYRPTIIFSSAAFINLLISVFYYYGITYELF